MPSACDYLTHSDGLKREADLAIQKTEGILEYAKRVFREHGWPWPSEERIDEDAEVPEVCANP